MLAVAGDIASEEMRTVKDIPYPREIKVVFSKSWFCSEFCGISCTSFHCVRNTGLPAFVTSGIDVRKVTATQGDDVITDVKALLMAKVIWILILSGIVES